MEKPILVVMDPPKFFKKAKQRKAHKAFKSEN